MKLYLQLEESVRSLECVVRTATAIRSAVEYWLFCNLCRTVEAAELTAVPPHFLSSQLK